MVGRKAKIRSRVIWREDSSTQKELQLACFLLVLNRSQNSLSSFLHCQQIHLKDIRTAQIPSGSHPHLPESELKQRSLVPALRKVSFCWSPLRQLLPFATCMRFFFVFYSFCTENQLTTYCPTQEFSNRRKRAGKTENLKVLSVH